MQQPFCYGKYSVLMQSLKCLYPYMRLGFLALNLSQFIHLITL